jgi:predicted PurR-regulated permease PerM
MRLLSLLSRISGFGALWIVIVLLCGVVGTLLPVLWSGSPSGSEDYGAAAIMMFWGFVGLFAGTLPATLCVMLVAERTSRRTQEKPLRSSESKA